MKWQKRFDFTTIVSFSGMLIAFFLVVVDKNFGGLLFIISLVTYLISDSILEARNDVMLEIENLKLENIERLAKLQELQELKETK